MRYKLLSQKKILSVYMLLKNNADYKSKSLQSSFAVTLKEN